MTNLRLQKSSDTPKRRKLEDLMALHVQGDQEASIELITQINSLIHGAMVMYGGASLSEEDKEDFFQKQLFRILDEVLPKHAPEKGASASTWIYLDTRNQLKNLLKSLQTHRKRHVDVPTESWNTLDETVADPVSSNFPGIIEAQSMLGAIKSRLSPKNRIILDLWLETGGDRDEVLRLLSEEHKISINPRSVNRIISTVIRPLVTKMFPEEVNTLLRLTTDTSDKNVEPEQPVMQSAEDMEDYIPQVDDPTAASPIYVIDPVTGERRLKESYNLSLRTTAAENQWFNDLCLWLRSTIYG